MSEKYREFNSAEEANSWGREYYSDLYSKCKDKTMLLCDSLIKSLYAYTGSNYKMLNELLRVCTPMNSQEFEGINFGEYEDEKPALIEINKKLKNYTTPENIIVYRYTHKHYLRKLCPNGKVKIGTIFSDKAFFSTTLVKDLLKDFAIENHCNCILKLYLPKGTPRAYISFKGKQSLLNEQEFLLPTNMKFMITKKQKFTRWPIIDCQAIVSKENNA